MRFRKTKMFFAVLVGTMICGTTVVSAAPTAGFSSYMSYLTSTGNTGTAGVSAMLSTQMISTAKTEMLAGVTINIENLEHSSVASNGESELNNNTIEASALGMAIDDEYTYMAVALTSGYINVREAATTESAVAGKLYNKNVAQILSVEGDWYRIVSGNVSGYVRSDLVKVGDEELLKSLGTYTYAESKAEEQARLEKEREEQRKKAAASAQAYLDYVNRYYGSTVAGVSGQAIADYAVQFVGYPYVLGGNSLTRGTDCSGFVKLVYAQFGITMPRIPEGDMYMGRPVSQSEMKPGDVVCYGGHVAIYIGGGKIVHALNSRVGIVITNNVNFQRVYTVRRIVE